MDWGNASQNLLSSTAHTEMCFIIYTKLHKKYCS
jgi:hypothetical protein